MYGAVASVVGLQHDVGAVGALAVGVAVNPGERGGVGEYYAVGGGVRVVDD